MESIDALTTPAKVLATGMVNIDVLAVSLPNVALNGRVVYCPEPIRTQIGGHPVNVGINLLNLGYPRENVAVAIALGDGIYAELVRKTLDKNGLNASVKNIASIDSGVCVVLKVAGEDRRFHIDPGANWYLDKSHVVDAIDVFRPDIFCIRGGYAGFDNNMPEILDAVQGFAGMTFLDVCPPHPSRDPKFLVDAVSRANLLHCNAHELELVSGQKSLRKGLRWLREMGVRLAFVSSGEDGVIAISQNAAIQQKGYVIDDVDPTGAGDAFCTGVVHRIALDSDLRLKVGILDEQELAHLLLYPQAVGAAAATVVGCTGGANTATVDHLMQSQAFNVLSSTQSFRL